MPDETRRPTFEPAAPATPPAPQPTEATTSAPPPEDSLAAPPPSSSPPAQIDVAPRPRPPRRHQLLLAVLGLGVITATGIYSFLARPEPPVEPHRRPRPTAAPVTSDQLEHLAELERQQREREANLLERQEREARLRSHNLKSRRLRQALADLARRQEQRPRRRPAPTAAPAERYRSLTPSAARPAGGAPPTAAPDPLAAAAQLAARGLAALE
ncbi:MAG: hypothetical protein D6696_15405, partial [Acidobacteria bacterium]